MDSKIHYQDFINQYPGIPVFFAPWWLDLVCGPDQWGVCLYYDANGVVIGALPYPFIKRFGLKASFMPTFTPYLGFTPWVSAQNTMNQYRQVSEHLILQLPSLLYQRIHLNPDTIDVIPWLNHDFRITTHYTFILDLTRPSAEIFNQFQSGLRRKIRQASKLIQVKTVDDPEAFYCLNQKTFRFRKVQIPYNKHFFLKFDQVLASKKLRKIYLAYDHFQHPIAGLYILQDQKTIYYLASGLHRHKSPQGAIAFLVWQAIQDFSGKVEFFDFEGSMIPGVAQFFSGFSGKLTPYYVAVRYSHPGLEFAHQLWKKSIK